MEYAYSIKEAEAFDIFAASSFMTEPTHIPYLRSFTEIQSVILISTPLSSQSFLSLNSFSTLNIFQL